MKNGYNGFKFEEVTSSDLNHAKYTDGCSGSRSDCCTRVCTRVEPLQSRPGDIQAWDRYLEVNAGVVQY